MQSTKLTDPIPGLEEKVVSLWSEGNKFGLWLEIERSLVIAWSDYGTVPSSDALKVYKDAAFDAEAIARYEREIHHDVNAFIRSVQDSLGEEARWFHYGVTGSDIVDTALAMQMKGTVLMGIGALTHGMSFDGVRRDDTKHVVSFATLQWIYQQLFLLAQRVNYGQLSGPVGTNATLPREVEESVCQQLGLLPLPVSTQIVSRDIHADYAATIALVCSVLGRELGYPHRSWAMECRSMAAGLMNNIALWHERDISHSSIERVFLPKLSKAFILTLQEAILRKDGYSVRRESDNER